VILPHAFPQEHVETLVELDVEYKHIADELGIKGYYRAQTVGVHPAYIGGLAKMVVKQAASEKITSDTGKCVCPEKFDRCCMRAYSA
jgi:ferrochelatase